MLRSDSPLRVGERGPRTSVSTVPASRVHEIFSTHYEVTMARLKYENLPDLDDDGRKIQDRDDGLPLAVRKHGLLFATPSLEDIQRMIIDNVIPALDECSVEPDGQCPHGYPSWLVALGLI